MAQDLLSAAYILITIIVGIIYRKKYFGTNLKYFFYVLGALGLVEGLGMYIKYFNHDFIVPNFQIYNVGVIVHTLGFIYTYYAIVEDQKHKSYFKLIGLTFALFCIFSFYFSISFIKGFNSYNFIFGAWSIVVAIAVFFKKIINTEKVMHLTKFIWFWISIGMLIFYSGMIPIMLGKQFFGYSINNVQMANLILSFIMYTCFNIGFIWSSKQHNHFSL